MKKFIFSLLSLISIFFVAGCSTKNDNDKTKDTSATNQYTITVIDLDGDNLGEKVIDVDDYSSLFDALITNFDVDYTTSEYGAYISSINNSIVDSNYYVAIYENGTLASTGVEGLAIDSGDKFEFRVECWNTVESGYGVLDSYDLLVDKLVYNYAKTYMVSNLASALSYTGTAYWDLMSINMMASKGYDKNVFNADALTDTFVNELTLLDVNTLSGANIGKYYYALKALNLNTDNFKTFYQNYVTNTISTDYSEYTMPFITSPAKYLEVEGDKLTELIQTEYLAGTEWGIDGLTWQVTSLQLFDKYTSDILSNFTAQDYGNGTSTALALLPYAALNENVRDEKYEVDGKDLLEILIDNYYDEEKCLLKCSLSDNGVNYSTNQIYAGLMAYKAQRDLNASANIFA